MAKKDLKIVKKVSLDSKAKSTPEKEEVSTSVKKRKTPSATATLKTAGAPARGFWGYLSGSWYELRQVRWPNRSATWSLTLAVLVFTAFFVLIIVGLDNIFQYLFKEVLLK